MEIYQVGGAVRDHLLGLPTQDKDWVVVGATPETLLALGYTQVGRDFPVFLHPVTHEEYALARTERKIHAGYKGFQVYAAPDVTLEADLSRRDLTINAMAISHSGQLIDPFNGYADLQARILRHVSPAFVEDPVRILRVARFAARLGDFNVAPETVDLMRSMVDSGEVNALVPERVWQELVRALGAPYPHRFIQILRSCGALAVIFPEIDHLFGVPQPATYHPEIDTGEHLLLCLQAARRLTTDTHVLFAVLTHDLGKGTTPVDTLPHHYGHEERSVELLSAFCDRYHVPTAYQQIALLVARYHSHCHRATQLSPRTLLKVLLAVDAFRRPQRLEQFLLAVEADARGRLGLTERPYPQADLMRKAYTAASQVNIADVLTSVAEKTGAAISQELHRRRLHAIAQQLQEQCPSPTDFS